MSELFLILAKHSLIAERIRLFTSFLTSALTETFFPTTNPTLTPGVFVFLIFTQRKSPFIRRPLRCTSLKSSLFVNLFFRASTLFTYETVSFLRCFRRRRAKTLLPVFIPARCKKPCAFFLLCFLGWYVIDIYTNLAQALRKINLSTCFAHSFSPFYIFPTNCLRMLYSY